MPSSNGPQRMFFTQRRKETTKAQRKIIIVPCFLSLCLCVKYSAELPEYLRMDRGNRFRVKFRPAIVRKQSIDLLLDVRQLRVAEARQELERRDALHQVAILFQQLFRLLKRIIESIKQIALLRRNVFRYREETSDLRQHDRLAAISRPAREEWFVDPDLRR